MRSTLLRPLGLITRPNKYGQFPPGALSNATNVCLRDRGILASLPGIRELTNAAVATDQVKNLFPIDTDRLLLAADDRMQFVDGAATSAVTTTAANGFTTAPTFDTVKGTTYAGRSRGRTFVTSDDGVIAFDDEVSFTAARTAGLPFPSISVSAVTGTNAQSMANNTARGYRACLVRVFSDGYELRSEVSAPIRVTNAAGGTEDPTLSVNWLQRHSMAAGDWVEIYRTKDVAIASDPGDRMFLCARAILTSTDITNRFCSVRDTTVDANLSEAELYTNPAQQGLQNTNTPPPLAHDVCHFKGHTFYLSYEVIPYYQFTIASTFGNPLSSTTERLYGIGTRALTVDTTLDSPTAINGSNMNGVVIGQVIAGSGIPANTRITGVSGTTITMSANATATAAGVSVTVTDVIEYGAGASEWQTMGPNNTIFGGGIGLVYTNTPRIYAITGAAAVGLTDPDVGRTVTWRMPRTFAGTFTVRATNGANYAPALPEVATGTAVPAIVDRRTNRFHTSKLDLPEAVPVGNFQFVGSGTVHRLIPTKDAVYAFASDGLYIITGSEWPWRVDPVDRTLVLVDRMAVDVLDDVIYALTNRGLVAIVGNTIEELSREAIDLGSDGVEVGDGHAYHAFVACDSKHREVWVHLAYAVLYSTYVFNVQTRAFVSFDAGEVISRFAYHKGLSSIIYTDADSSPDINYFRLDTDTTRLAGADVRFQPVTGDGDPFTQKHWSECEFLFEGVTGAATLVPSFEGTNYNARAIPTSAVESKCKVAIPRNGGAIGTRLRPGFTLSAGGTSQLWSLRGVSLRFTSVAEQGARR